jgi:hypothetical protein
LPFSWLVVAVKLAAEGLLEPVAEALAAGLTVEQLVARNPKIRRVEDMLELLRGSERMGLVEQVDGRWKLTDRARREFGWALREMAPL